MTVDNINITSLLHANHLADGYKEKNILSINTCYSSIVFDTYQFSSSLYNGSLLGCFFEHAEQNGFKQKNYVVFVPLNDSFSRLNAPFIPLNDLFSRLNAPFIPLNNLFSILNGSFIPLNNSFARLNGSFSRLNGLFSRLNNSFILSNILFNISIIAVLQHFYIAFTYYFKLTFQEILRSYWHKYFPDWFIPNR